MKKWISLFLTLMLALAVAAPAVFRVLYREIQRPDLYLQRNLLGQLSGHDGEPGAEQHQLCGRHG